MNHTWDDMIEDERRDRTGTLCSYGCDTDCGLSNDKSYLPALFAYVCIKGVYMPYKNREDFNAMRKREYNKRKAFLAAYKKHEGCKVCGESDPVVLDFHHNDPEDKELPLANCVSAPIDKVFREVLKCTVLCANDHRRLEAGLITL